VPHMATPWRRLGNRFHAPYSADRSSRRAGGPTVESALSSAGAPTPGFGPQPELGGGGHDDHNARPSSLLVPVTDPLFTVGEQQALAGFLCGYSGLTRDAYTLDLRQYTAWCTGHGLHLFAAKRVDIESFHRDMEAVGRARATIARRLCAIAGFYGYAVEEEPLDHSPAAHMHRPDPELWVMLF